MAQRSACSKCARLSAPPPPEKKTQCFRLFPTQHFCNAPTSSFHQYFFLVDLLTVAQRSGRSKGARLSTPHKKADCFSLFPAKDFCNAPTSSFPRNSFWAVLETWTMQIAWLVRELQHRCKQTILQDWVATLLIGPYQATLVLYDHWSVVMASRRKSVIDGAVHRKLATHLQNPRPRPHERQLYFLPHLTLRDASTSKQKTAARESCLHEESPSGGVVGNWHLEVVMQGTGGGGHA